MYDLVSNLIDHNWVTGSSEQQYVYFTCCALVIILTVVVIDLVYCCVSHFWK